MSGDQGNALVTAESRDSEASALSLDQRTELNQIPQYDFDPLLDGVSHLVTVRQFGSDLVEVGYSSVRPLPSERQEEEALEKRRSSSRSTLSDQQKKRNLERSARRSKAQVRRKCMVGGLDHMLTLTYRCFENCPSPKGTSKGGLQ